MIVVVRIENEIRIALDCVIVPLDIDTGPLDTVVVPDDDSVDIFQKILLDPLYQSF